MTTMRSSIRNLPNIISVFRVFLVPVIVYLILTEDYVNALWLFLIAGISDALDGFIARRFDMRTRFGAALDPLADKILILSTVLALFSLGLLPVWLMAVIVCRDVVIAGGAVAWHFGIGRVEIAPTFISKVNTFLQVGIIFLVLGRAAGMPGIAPWLPFLFVLVFLTSIASGLQYVLVWGRKALDNRRPGG